MCFVSVSAHVFNRGNLFLLFLLIEIYSVCYRGRLIPLTFLTQLTSTSFYIHVNWEQRVVPHWEQIVFCTNLFIQKLGLHCWIFFGGVLL